MIFNDRRIMNISYVHVKILSILRSKVFVQIIKDHAHDKKYSIYGHGSEMASES